MKNLSKNYIRTQIETASKPQLLIMLFDGAIRFVEQARAALVANSLDESHNVLVRSQRIVLELVAALDRSRIEPDLYRNLTSLYMFVYRRLVSANMERRADHAEEALSLLRHLRETWTMAIEKMDPETKREISLRSTTIAEPQSLSVRG